MDGSGSDVEDAPVSIRRTVKSGRSVASPASPGTLFSARKPLHAVPKLDLSPLHDFQSGSTERDRSGSHARLQRNLAQLALGSPGSPETREGTLYERSGSPSADGNAEEDTSAQLSARLKTPHLAFKKGARDRSDSAKKHFFWPSSARSARSARSQSSVAPSTDCGGEDGEDDFELDIGLN